MPLTIRNGSLLDLSEWVIVLPKNYYPTTRVSGDVRKELQLARQKLKTAARETLVFPKQKRSAHILRYQLPETEKHGAEIALAPFRQNQSLLETEHFPLHRARAYSAGSHPQADGILHLQDRQLR